MCPEYTPEFVTRFWNRLAKTDGCWTWTGAIGRNGYGYVKFQGRTLLVHRVAYELTHGEIPSGHFVMHQCDNRACGNPEHLSAGTHQENMSDMRSKGRSRAALSPETLLRGDDHPLRRNPELAARGEGHGGSKLTEIAVREIRRLHRLGKSQRAIAKQFDTDRTNVALIVKNKTWRHVK